MSASSRRRPARARTSDFGHRSTRLSLTRATDASKCWPRRGGCSAPAGLQASAAILGLLIGVGVGIAAGAGVPIVVSGLICAGPAPMSCGAKLNGHDGPTISAAHAEARHTLAANRPLPLRCTVPREHPGLWAAALQTRPLTTWRDGAAPVHATAVTGHMVTKKGEQAPVPLAVTLILSVSGRAFVFNGLRPPEARPLVGAERAVSRALASRASHKLGSADRVVPHRRLMPRQSRDVTRDLRWLRLQPQRPAWRARSGP